MAVQADEDDDDVGDRAAETSAAGSLRLDKWLWFTRAVKSRTLAAGLIEAGKARINREKVARSSQTVRIGDVVTLTVAHRVRVLEVAALGTRRGPATEAATLYIDLTPPETRQPGVETESGEISQSLPNGPAANRDRGLGRPTKRDRRLTDRLRDRD